MSLILLHSKHLKPKPMYYNSPSPLQFRFSDRNDFDLGGIPYSSFGVCVSVDRFAGFFYRSGFNPVASVKRELPNV